MIIEVIAIVVIAALMMAVGYPLVTAFSKARKEMEEMESENE